MAGSNVNLISGRTCEPQLIARSVDIAQRWNEHRLSREIEVPYSP